MKLPSLYTSYRGNVVWIAVRFYFFTAFHFHLGGRSHTSFSDRRYKIFISHSTTSCKSTWDTVPYFGINALSMILCLWFPLYPLSKLLAIQDHTQNLEEQLWMGGRREVSIIFYRPATRSDLKQERSFFRGSVSTFLQLVVAISLLSTSVYTLKFNPLLLLLFLALKVQVVMRFTAKKRGWMKCEIFTPVYKSGRTYGRTILSEPTFLGCIDKQIFLPTVLRYPCFARENSTINTSTCEGKLVCDWLEEITKKKSIHIFVLMNWSTKDWKFRNALLPFWQQVLILYT